MGAKPVKPSPDRKMIKSFLHLITCCRHYDILAKTRTRLTMAITFSRQNDAGSRASNTIEKISYLKLSNVVVAETRTKKLEVLSFCDRERA